METDQVPHYNNKHKKGLLLGVVVILYLLVITPLLVFNAQNKQETRGRAQTPQQDQSPSSELTTSAIPQSAQSLCTTSGAVEIGVAYTNTEPSRSLNVIATDQVSGKSVVLGTIPPGQTNTGVFANGNNSVPDGTIKFSPTYEDGGSQATQSAANYTAKSCSPVNQSTLSKSNTSAVDTQAVCGNVTTDTILVTDTSGSMGQENKLVQAKNSANNFIDVVSRQEATNRLGLATYASAGTLKSQLTTDYASVKSKVNSLTANGSTCIQCGIKKANADIQATGRPGVKKVVVLLTDGIANYIEGSTREISPAIAEQAALDAALAGRAANGTVYFVIGFGNDVNKPFLQNLATQTGGKFYFPAPNELDGVYQEISQLIGRGLLGGFIFNDSNLNGAFDANEPKLSGWNVKAVSSAGTSTATSDTYGNYVMTGLCDGTYQLSQVMKPGWVQTMPSNAAGYSVNITNAAQYNDKLFGNTDKARCSDKIDNDYNGYTDDKDSSCHTDGNPLNPGSYDPKKDGEHGGGNTCADSKDNNNNGVIDGGDPVCHTDKNPNNPGSYDPNLPEVSPTPTPTRIPTAVPTVKPTAVPTPKGTSFSLTTYQHGIGNSGDNSNPASSFSNKTPKHTEINADIILYNDSNQLIASGAGKVTYNTQNGNYTGTIGIYPNGFPSGKYTMKVRTQYHLRRLMAGIQTITGGQNNNHLPDVTLVAGDGNDDNKLNILDYNLLLDCYSDLAAATACNTTKKVQTDYNDDSSVNQIDYNLLLREIATQPGE